jgi:hypothetical protein
MRTPTPFASSLLACLLLGACDVAPPPPADPDAKLEAKDKGEHHELQSAIDAVDHRDKAAAAGDAVKEADKKREEELKDAGG